MNYFYVDKLQELDNQNKWLKFIDNNPHKTIFQTFLMFQFWDSQKNHSPRLHFVEDK